MIFEGWILLNNRLRPKKYRGGRYLFFVFYFLNNVCFMADVFVMQSSYPLFMLIWGWETGKYLWVGISKTCKHQVTGNNNFF